MKTVLLFALVLAVASAQVFDQPCGTEMSCQSGQSCCTSEVATGCCPFENGVCCSDGFHCCPANAVCDSVTGTCRTTGNFFSEVPLQRTLPALHAPAVLRQFVAKLQGAATVKDCGDSSYLAHFDSTTLSPTTPVKGKQVDMTGAASATNAFTGGKYKMVAKMSGAQVFTHSGDVCGTDKVSLPLGMGTINYSGPSCPQDAGSFNVGMSVVVPTAAPSAAYTFLLDTTDSNGNKLFCLQADFNL